MKLIAPEIPDDPAALPGWLERHLLGLDLAALVAELEAVHGPTPAGPQDLLGGHRDEVLARGLSALPPERLRQFLRRPRALLDLQELILTEGGPYWQRAAPAAASQSDLLERGRSRALEFASGARASREDPVLTLPPSRPTPWHRRPWVVSLATAAAVVAAAVVYDRSRPPAAVAPVMVTSSGWGWSRPGALDEDGTPAEYLNRLADAAGEWFRQRPDDPAALARRIAEFRQGCSALILSEHKPLSPADRRWLTDRCRAWAAKLDAHLTAVEAGEDPAKVRAEADETVNALINALRERAAGLS